LRLFIFLALFLPTCSLGHRANASKFNIF
jgi:hypothetical protein